LNVDVDTFENESPLKAGIDILIDVSEFDHKILVRLANNDATGNLGIRRANLGLVARFSVRS
jgi:hypothetical protein